MVGGSLKAYIVTPASSYTCGQDLIEYALMAGFVAVAAGAVMPGVATSIRTRNGSAGPESCGYHVILSHQANQLICCRLRERAAAVTGSTNACFASFPGCGPTLLHERGHLLPRRCAHLPTLLWFRRCFRRRHCALRRSSTPLLSRAKERQHLKNMLVDSFLLR